MYLKKTNFFKWQITQGNNMISREIQNFEQTTKGKYTNIDEEHNMLRPLQEPLGSWFEQSSIFDGVKLGM